MKSSFTYMTNLQYEVKNLRKQVESFQSGERYLQLEKEYRKIISELEREIRRLKSELAAAHAQMIDMRNKWFQTCEDVIKEKEKELARKDREVEKALAAMKKTQKKCDEALEKLHNKTQELYEVKTQLRGRKRKKPGADSPNQPGLYEFIKILIPEPKPWKNPQWKGKDRAQKGRPASQGMPIIKENIKNLTEP